MKTFTISYPLTRALSFSPSSARLAGSTGAGMRITNNILSENSAAGTFIGTLSTFGTTGTPVFTLVNSASNKIALSGTNNVTVQAGAANTDYEVTPFYSFTVSVTGVAPVLPNTTFQIVVTDVLEPVAPANTVLPSISGSPYVGQTLTCDTGTWTGVPTPTYTYQWKYFGGGNIAGETASSLLLTGGMAGVQVQCVVTATNGSGSVSATSSPSAAITSGAPSNTVSPSISGSLAQGSLLTVDPGTWVGPPTIVLTYQWNSVDVGSTPIPGATSINYVTQPSDVGLRVNCRVTATNIYGSAQNFGGPVGPITGTSTLPVNTLAPAITGSTTVGSILSASPGTWTGSPTPTFTYQWKSGATNVGTNSTSYTLLAGDVGNNITCVVTGTNTAGSVNATSNSLGPVSAAASPPANAGGANLPVISGGLTVGNLLSTTDGTWTGSPAPTFTYQWKRAGANIAGATANNYTTVSGDLGTMISVTVTGTNGSGNASATATAVGPIVASGGPSLDFSDPDNSGYIPGIL